MTDAIQEQHQQAFTALADETSDLLVQRIAASHGMPERISTLESLQASSLAAHADACDVLGGANLDVDAVKEAFSGLVDQARELADPELAGKFQQCQRLFLAAAAPPWLHTFAAALNQNPALKAMMEQATAGLSQAQQDNIAKAALPVLQNPQAVEIGIAMASAHPPQQVLDSVVQALADDPAAFGRIDQEELPRAQRGAEAFQQDSPIAQNEAFRLAGTKEKAAATLQQLGGKKEDKGSGWLFTTLAVVGCVGVGYGALRWWRRRSCTR